MRQTLSPHWARGTVTRLNAVIFSHGRDRCQAGLPVYLMLSGFARPEVSLAHSYDVGAALKPEERARQKIDQLLEASGWIVQSREKQWLEHELKRVELEARDVRQAASLSRDEAAGWQPAVQAALNHEARLTAFHRRWFLRFEEILHRADEGPTWLKDERIASQSPTALNTATARFIGWMPTASCRTTFMSSSSRFWMKKA